MLSKSLKEEKRRTGNSINANIDFLPPPSPSLLCEDFAPLPFLHFFFFFLAASISPRWGGALGEERVRYLQR